MSRQPIKAALRGYFKLGIVNLMACGITHRWLEIEYPDKYKMMLSNIGKLTKQYPKLTNGIDIVEIKNATLFCKENGLQSSNLSKVLPGKRGSHKGWYIYKEKSNE